MYVLFNLKNIHINCFQIISVTFKRNSAIQLMKNIYGETVILWRRFLSADFQLNSAAMQSS